MRNDGQGSRKQLKRLLFVLLVFTLCSAGCAHRRVVAHSPASKDPSFHPKGETTTSATERGASNLAEAEDTPDKDIDVFLDEGITQEVVSVADPFSPWNRAMFHFNDRLYFWVLKPIARGYRAVIPSIVRSSVKNFFHNLTTPIRMVSCILQGKGREASTEFGRFLINSTAGLLGIDDPAKRWFDLDPKEEDMGQALGTYGIGNGFYIVWPILGSSTLRDSVGMIGDWFLNPVSYVDPKEAYLEIRTLETVNETSFQIGDYESFKKAAIDPYVAVRDAYIQYRHKKVEE
jgi:phospholipid-binding lipoprotein MlaA